MSERQRRVARKVARAMKRDVHGRFMPRPVYNEVVEDHRLWEGVYTLANQVAEIRGSLKRINKKLDEIEELIRVM